MEFPNLLTYIKFKVFRKAGVLVKMHKWKFDNSSKKKNRQEKTFPNRLKPSSDEFLL